MSEILSKLGIIVFKIIICILIIFDIIRTDDD